MFYQLLVSHFTFDYGYALTPSMLRAKSKGWPLYPILLHASLHSIGVLIVLLLNGYTMNDQKCFNLFSFQFISHFLIDWAKGMIETRWSSLKNPSNPWHWHLFQIDQFLHVTVMYVISII